MGSKNPYGIAEVKIYRNHCRFLSGSANQIEPYSAHTIVTVVVIHTEAHKIIETFECRDDCLLIFPDEFKLLFVY